MKVCDRCGRRYAPTGNRQRWCRACRLVLDEVRRSDDGSPRGFFGFVPVERECACCGRTFVARQPNQRYCGSWCRRQTSMPAEAAARRRALYGNPVHKGRRRAWEPSVAAGVVRCARGAACKRAELVDGDLVGGLILPGERWHLGHPDGESVGYAPEHVACNTGAPSRLRARSRSRVW